MIDKAAIFAELGIEMKRAPLGEVQAKAREIGLEVTEEEAAAYSLDIRHSAETAAACAACKALESCPNDNTGYEFVASRSSGGRLWFGVRKCARRLQYEEMNRSEALLASSRIPEHLRVKSFRAFDGDGNEGAIAIATAIVKDRERKGVIFYGPTGVGKTHLAAAILNNRIITGGTGIYATVPELMDDIRAAMRNNTVEAAREAILSTDLLFLDDLGVENPSEFVVEELFKIVNGRLLRGKQIIGTTNLAPEVFGQRYAGLGGQRILSRLYEACDWVAVGGRDRRIG